MREIVDTDDPEEASVMGSEDLSPDYNLDLLIPSDASNRSIEDHQPDPVPSDAGDCLLPASTH